MGALTYSGTAASNTTVDGIGAAGSDSPDNIDNLVRALAASDANLVKDLGGFNTVAGTADAITITLADASTITNYTDKLIGFVAASDNATTSPTLNVDSVGAEPIKKTVQGVETALIAGDIQAGGYYLVRWRSTWDTGGGAWELINPALESQIELGHATDTTLTRSAAGVMAVEGNVVPSPSSQAQHDILVRGASSWNRLAIGTPDGKVLKISSGTPAWDWPTTFGATVTAATGTPTAIPFTGIGSGASEVDVIFSEVSTNGTDDLLIQLGDAGGIEATGYTSSCSTITTVVATTSSTAGFIIANASASSLISGVVQLRRVGGATWVASYCGKDLTTQTFVGGGGKALTDTLTQLNITTTGGTNTFDGGFINISWR
jgi:hypothetical protein